MGMKAYVLKYQFIRLFFAMIPSAQTRSRLLKKFGYFKAMGQNVHFQPRKMPADPKFIIFHNNIVVASAVTFITHDVMHYIFNSIQPDDAANEYKAHLGCIEVMDNVFIGSGAMIMPNVRIEENSIIAAGSIVTKDVKAGTVVGGNPAKVIGDFDTVMKKRALESENTQDVNRLLRVDSEWEKFRKQRQ